ncbi:MBL fold metallo-hydrolase [Streptomyces cellulosae]|uniref:MBL fold metallo-hydrolase n=1 Tax=Streptomyces cellulosae TaxID=1968 RepID=UPI0019015D7D|nr:MBL fold metallo-hydrolase [Streptomyces cellulosae]
MLAAHTTNDSSLVWIPERRVLFAGDLLFNGGTPFLVQGSVAGAISVLEDIVAPLGADIIVPGHGPVGGPQLIEDVLDYLRFVQATAREGRRRDRPRCRPRTKPTSDRTPNSPEPHRAPRSMSPPRWPTWSRTTAAVR